MSVSKVKFISNTKAFKTFTYSKSEKMHREKKLICKLVKNEAEPLRFETFMQRILFKIYMSHSTPFHCIKASPYFVIPSGLKLPIGRF